VFLYPAVAKGPAEPAKAKLRLLYEAAPLAYIVDQAGGYASDGEGPVLRREPRSLHERVPLFLGSLVDVQFIEAVLRGQREVPLP
jgi:fructose-1,6-bisphosphatase I